MSDYDYTKPVYIWRDGKVITDDVIHYFEVTDYVLDSSHKSQYMRYGRFTDKGNRWEHIPLENFPYQFKAALLLMGVPL